MTGIGDRETGIRTARASAFLAGSILTLVAAACGGPSTERQLLTKFFDASKIYDKTVLASLGSVSFNPSIDGVVEDFTVTNVQPASGSEPPSEQVTVSARIRTAGGALATRALTVTMEKANGRWTIVALR